MFRVLLMMVCLGAMACGNDSQPDTRLDTLEHRIDSSLEAIADSVEVKANRLEDSIDIRLNQKDSVDE